MPVKCVYQGKCFLATLVLATAGVVSIPAQLLALAVCGKANPQRSNTDNFRMKEE